MIHPVKVSFGAGSSSPQARLEEMSVKESMTKRELLDTHEELRKLRAGVASNLDDANEADRTVQAPSICSSPFFSVTSQPYSGPGTR